MLESCQLTDGKLHIHGTFWTCPEILHQKGALYKLREAKVASDLVVQHSFSTVESLIKQWRSCHVYMSRVCACSAVFQTI